MTFFVYGYGIFTPHVCVYGHVVYVLHIHMYIRVYIGIKGNRIQNHIGWRLTPGMFHSSHCWNHVDAGITIIFSLVENPTYQGTEVWKLHPLNTARFTTLKVKMHIMAASCQHKRALKELIDFLPSTDKQSSFHISWSWTSLCPVPQSLIPARFKIASTSPWDKDGLISGAQVESLKDLTIKWWLQMDARP